MANMEFQDDISNIAEDMLQDYIRAALWERWDRIKTKRFKLHWGFFRPSFKYEVLEPFFIKLVGPRPE